jgi:alkylated DNA repair dioxygenase AlkB
MLFKEQNLLPFDGDVLLFESFFDQRESNEIFEKLKTETVWKQEGMKIFGKEVPFPRLTAWYAKEGKNYTYSGLRNTPQALTPLLEMLKDNCEVVAKTPFNSALLNYYRQGSDSMGWHADNETELGPNPVIASLTFGASRKFQFKHRTVPKSTQNIVLNHGSLLIMQGSTQHHWLHQVPKSTSSGVRINITFRNIL